jgi:hypothetical protein
MSTCTDPRPPRSPETAVPCLTLVLSGLLLRLLGRLDDDRQRGDVPGWVLITVMTAGLVTAIWVVAKDQLEQILTDALNSVTGPKDA